MGSSEKFFDIISGRNQSIGAALLRTLLWSLTPIYFFFWWWRDQKYNRNKKPIFRAAAPTISIGNLTTGGTGKTPLVLWVAQFLAKNNFTTVILSRGYGALPDQHNDEYRELKFRAPAVEHLQDPDRSKIAKKAVEQFSADALLLDDGFQHRRLARNLDIVVLDATCPFGFGFLLPRGLLREPKSSIRRAHIVVISRFDQIEGPQRQNLVTEIKSLAPQAIIIKTCTRLSALVNHEKESVPLHQLAGKQIAAFAGIGNPQNFARSLAGASLEVSVHRWFPDHHHYQLTDLISLQSLARENNCAALVCTLKDLVKIEPGWKIEMPLYAAIADLEFVDGQELLESGILDLL